ncbi:pre-toxin TG domain-containing protein, partial [Metabacillus sp. GX 13764]|uniref:pre-toxin TG domain-containing protein n=1 Tax=Metabacillus kandeliae TaxID=2900151 RepID=UPI001E6007A9
EMYKVNQEAAKQTTEYINAKNEQAEARRVEKAMIEKENRPWYEKGWDMASDFVGEVSGYYDAKRAATGVDPVTGRKLSEAERIAAGAMAVAGFIPVLGWAGRAAKGGKAIYSTVKGVTAASKTMDAYKTVKGMEILGKTEKGIYGLVSANGLAEGITGRDMFGNQLTDEQRKNSLFAGLTMLGIGGAGAALDKYGPKIPVPNITKPKMPFSNEHIKSLQNKANEALSHIKNKVGELKLPIRIKNEVLVSPQGQKFPILTIEKEPLKKLYPMAFSAKSGENVKINIKSIVGKKDLDDYRAELNVSKTHTIAVGKAEIPILENSVFKGASPEVRNQANLPSLDVVKPDREFKAPYDHIKNPKLAQFTRHAEEGVLNEFNDAVIKTGIDPKEVTGNLYIHQSNPRGVCNKCTKGLNKPFPEDKCGIFYQASMKYPNLKIIVTSEIDESVKTNGLTSFILQNGKIICK